MEREREPAGPNEKERECGMDECECELAAPVAVAWSGWPWGPMLAVAAGSLLCRSESSRELLPKEEQPEADLRRGDTHVT